MRRRQTTRFRDARPFGSERGVALLLALMFLMFFLAVTSVLVMLTVTETMVAGAEQARHVVRGAAEVAIERALQEVAVAADWNVILAGSARSTFVDADVTPSVADWGVLDVSALTARVQREADASNRWGPDGPVWRLFGYGPFAALLGGAGTGPPVYTVMWVADDEGEGDGNPAVDTNQCLTMRAEAFGPFRSRQVLVATVRRHPGGGLEVVSWRSPDGG
jgi:hypothetical protein